MLQRNNPIELICFPLLYGGILYVYIRYWGLSKVMFENKGVEKLAILFRSDNVPIKNKAYYQ